MVSPRAYLVFHYSTKILCETIPATEDSLDISGMEKSNFILAINKDEDAPIFQIADIGIVGDCAKILPLFIEEVKKIKAN